jgi:hypothetical protein
MVDMSGVGSYLASFLYSGMAWMIAAIVLFGFGGFIYLHYSRKRKLKYNCLEVVRFGNGKVGMNLLKAGNFKTKTTFFGLIDYGFENVTKTSDGRRIQGAKTSYLHDVMGWKGYICLRKSNDPKILVPIEKIEIENLALIMAIAPVDLRDASVNIFKQASDETRTTLEKILPYIAVGMCVMLCIITVIICQQMTNNTVEKVGKVLIGGCENAKNTAPSSAP